MNAPSCLSDAALAAVKRAVWLRDGGRCAFVATDGHRCDARGFLEFHHLTPYAVGGKPTVDNIAALPVAQRL